MNIPGPRGKWPDTKKAYSSSLYGLRTLSKPYNCIAIGSIRSCRITLKKLSFIPRSAERRKARRQQEERLQFMRDYQKQKDKEAQQKKLEKEQDLQQLGCYFPFGKPGFGAPRVRDVFTKRLGC